MNHYPHHLGDYAKDTMGLSMLEHGAYRLLLDAYYAGELALDADEVYAIAKATNAAERKAVEKVLKRFELRGDKYYHKRVEEELVAYRKRSDTGTKNVAKRYQTATKDLPPSGSPGVLLASSHKPEEPNNPVKHSIGVGDIPAPPERLAALSAILAAKRIETTPAKSLLHLRQWAAEGVTDDQLADAILIAEDRLGNGQIRAAYLAPIVADLRAGRVSRIEPRGKDAIAGAIAAIAAKEANAPH